MPFVVLMSKRMFLFGYLLGLASLLCTSVCLFYWLNRVDGRTSSVVLVVSPLVALMIDQVQSLRTRGVACAIMSDHEGVEKCLLASETDFGDYHLLFCAPEAVILVERWRQLICESPLHSRIVAIAIDEAHCVSKW